MFGPLPPGNIEMGSIKMDRTNSSEIDIFPANVKRIKIYPGCVNFLKHFMNQGLNGKTLTKKRLDAIRKKFATILAEISGPKCMEHAEMLMSFRIEFTMALNESQKTLYTLREQLQHLKAQLLQKLQPYFKSSIIALEDIHTFCRWSLSRYNKICKGNSNTPFDDQQLAKHLVLSLWHGVGYHQFRFTQRMHKDYLVDLDMTGYDTDDDDDDELVAKHHRQKIDWTRSHPRQKIDWSRATDAAINTIIQALQYMNIINVAAANTGWSRLRYMYRRVCDFENDNAPCPWCYSEQARKNIEEHPDKLRLKNNYACKSKDFDTSIELAENVYERVKHHHDISSNGCTELIHSMFVAAREKTKEQEKVLREMAEMLKKKHPQYKHDLFKEFDKPHEQNQDAPLSKQGHKHVDWCKLTEANVEAISQALAFMNLFKPKSKVLRPKQRAKTGEELLSNVRPVLLQYMYKKVCDVQTGGDPCSWCYGEKACNQLKKNLGNSQPQKRTVACKSNIFDSADKLIEDVCGRLKHHHPDLSSNDWNKTLTEMFFPIQDKNLHEQQQVLKAMKEKRPVDPEQFQDLSPIINISTSPTIEECIQSRQQHETSAQRLGLGLERFEHKESSAIENNIDGIEDLFQDEFDTFNSACLELCKEMKIPDSTVSSDWMTFIEQNDQTFIKLSDCVYSSKYFAKGNAKCHFAWNPRTKNPMCIKVIENKSGNNHETEMLEKLMQHTGQKPGEHNIVKYYGHEVRQGHTCLKFEIVHPKNSFRKDLTNMSYRNVVTYMRELLKALDSLHNRYGITHRDIKPENFVHNFETNTFRLIDFESAVYKSHDLGIGLESAGTRGYKAPELLRQSNSAKSKWFWRQPGIDIWSAGIILMSLLTAQKDILSRNDNMATVDCNAKHWDEIGNIVGSKAMKNLNTPNWSNYGDGCKEGEKTGWIAKAVQLQLRKRSWTPSDEALDLLSRMLNVCPWQRITSQEALKHPWLNPQWLLDDDGADGFDKTANTTIEVDRAQGAAATVFNKIGADSDGGICSGGDAVRESNIVALNDTVNIYDAHQTESNTEARNVLARLEQNAEWTMAILTGCKGDNYEVYFVKTGETRCVTVQNVKNPDWKYWKQEMQSWTCEDFKKSLAEWKTQKDWIKGKGITASDHCQIGTVIADCSECEVIGNLNMGSFNSTNDFNCELVRVHNPDMPCRNQLSGSSEKESVAAFLVTTKYVHKGQQLTWFNADVGAAMKEGAAQYVSESGCHSAVVEKAHSGSDTDIIPNGINVLARLPEGEDWTRAIVEQRRGFLYDVYSVSMKKTQSISRRDIRTLDWDYWRTEMQSWTYADFKDALAQWNAQVGATVYPNMGRGVVALEECQIGTVVAEYSGYIAYKDNGGLFMGGLYPAMDVCMQRNNSVRMMQNQEWKDRKEHCVTLGRSRGGEFCIDGYATTCSTLDNLHDHGGVGWGALLNSAKKSKCNCTLLFVPHPDMCCADKYETLQKKDKVAAFLVTHKNVRRGDQLTWYYKGDCFYFD
jgi:serine/threonine protein kinase